MSEEKISHKRINFVLFNDGTFMNMYLQGFEYTKDELCCICQYKFADDKMDKNGYMQSILLFECGHFIHHNCLGISHHYKNCPVCRNLNKIRKCNDCVTFSLLTARSCEHFLSYVDKGIDLYTFVGPSIMILQKQMRELLDINFLEKYIEKLNPENVIKLYTELTDEEIEICEKHLKKTDYSKFIKKYLK